MNQNRYPVQGTVVYGLAAGLLSLPVSLALAPHLYWSKTVCLIITITILGYGLLLCRWSDKEAGRLFLPAIFLTGTALAGATPQLFLFLALSVLAWTRSSLCASRSILPAITVEAFMCGISMVLFFSLTPFFQYDTFSLAAGIWLFFLIQSLYFLLFQKTDRRNTPKNSFTKAQRVAEKIIAADGI